MGGGGRGGGGLRSGSLAFYHPGEMIKHFESHRCAADNVAVLLHSVQPPYSLWLFAEYREARSFSRNDTFACPVYAMAANGQKLLQIVAFFSNRSLRSGLVKKIRF